MERWIDYSSLSTFMSCPRKYWWRYIQHVTEDDSSLALINGTVYHDALALYYNARKDGASLEDGIRKVISFVKESPLATIYDNKRNVDVAVTTLSNFLLSWQDEEFQTLETDIGFSIDLNEFVFVGKIDRVVDSPFGLLIVEQKTSTIHTERWLSKGKPNLQIDGYVAAYYTLTGNKPSGGVLDVIFIHDKKLIKPQRVISMRTEEELDLWVFNTKKWYKNITNCLEENFFPMNQEQCIPLIGYTCQFHHLCLQYPLPFNGYELPNDFKIEKWEPWNIL